MTENPMQVAVEMAPLTDTPDAPVATVTPYDDDLEPSRGSVWHRRAGTFGAAALVTIIVLLAVYLATRALQKSDGSEGDGSEVHEWTPADAPLITIWGETGVPDAAPGYPRPLLTRADDTWRSLNGLWEFDASPASLDRPPFNTTLPLRILVPYPVESPLSGVRSLTAHGLSWYRLQRATSDLLPDGVPCAESTLLHFEASDWNTTVWIDGALLGSHAGGYDPFSFDVTAAFAATSDDDGAVEIIVGVADATSDAQAVGKQWVDAFSGPSGVRYTPTSGLWATVWLECAPAVRVDSVRTDTTNLAGAVALAVSLIIADGGDGDSDGLTLHATARDAAGGVVASASTSIAAGEDRVSLALDLDAPVALWSPQTPHLYSLELLLYSTATTITSTTTSTHAELIDAVGSYFGVRTMSLTTNRNGDGVPLLNGEPLFQIGTLDQGFWPDGNYAAPTDEALRFDVEAHKAMGFNMVRKHIKMEPRRWYFHTDTLGLLVWQDVPSKNNRAGLGDPIFDQWLSEMEREVDARAGHPSIVQWVTYNEGWGQTVDDAGATVAYTVGVLRARDTTRLIDDASGGRGCWPHGTNAVWAGGCHGDVTDVHKYSPPDWDTSEIDVSQRDRSKAFVIGEYGGILLTPTGHEWAVGQCNGYATVGDREELAALYAEYNTRIIDMMGTRFPALSAAVYTEITDVETECNGLLTYDRLYKADPVRIRAANEALIAQATGMLREAL